MEPKGTNLDWKSPLRLTEKDKEISERFLLYQFYPDRIEVVDLPTYKFSDLSPRFQSYIIRTLINTIANINLDMEEEGIDKYQIESTELTMFNDIIREPFGLECWHPPYFLSKDEEITGETYCKACNKFLPNSNSTESI